MQFFKLLALAAPLGFSLVAALPAASTDALVTRCNKCHSQPFYGLRKEVTGRVEAGLSLHLVSQVCDQFNSHFTSISAGFGFEIDASLDIDVQANAVVGLDLEAQVQIGASLSVEQWTSIWSDFHSTTESALR